MRSKKKWRFKIDLEKLQLKMPQTQRRKQIPGIGSRAISKQLNPNRPTTTQIRIKIVKAREDSLGSKRKIKR